MLLVAGHDQAITERLSAELAGVEARFAAELISDLTCVNALVGHVEQYRGKMLRPMLVLVGGMVAGAHDERSHAGALTDAHRVVATVVEMVHMATLVHDDVLDEADVRRRGDTVNHLSGNEAAVMLGDYLISHAYHLCSSLDRPQISRIIADTTNTVCEGELLQLANRNNWELDEGTYFEIIRRKTASLTGTCCRLGPVLAGMTDGVADALQDYGEKVGIAFQIIDDLLDLVGDEHTVGKSLGRDLVKGKLTLPLIHYLSAAAPDDRRAMLTLIQSVGAADNVEPLDSGPVADVRRRITHSASMAHARQWAERLIDDAKQRLERVPDSPARSLLSDMADAVLTRKS